MNTSTVLLQTNKKVSAESSVPRPWFYNMPPFCFPTPQWENKSNEWLLDGSVRPVRFVDCIDGGGIKALGWNKKERVVHAASHLTLPSLCDPSAQLSRKKIVPDFFVKRKKSCSHNRLRAFSMIISKLTKMNVKEKIEEKITLLPLRLCLKSSCLQLIWVQMWGEFTH